MNSAMPATSPVRYLAILCSVQCKYSGLAVVYALKKGLKNTQIGGKYTSLYYDVLKVRKETVKIKDMDQYIEVGYGQNNSLCLNEQAVFARAAVSGNDTEISRFNLRRGGMFFLPKLRVPARGRMLSSASADLLGINRRNTTEIK